MMIIILMAFGYVFLLALTAGFVVSALHVSSNAHNYIDDGEEIMPVLIGFVAWGRMVKGLFVKKPYRR